MLCKHNHKVWQSTFFAALRKMDILIANLLAAEETNQKRKAQEQLAQVHMIFRESTWSLIVLLFAFTHSAMLRELNVVCFSFDRFNMLLGLPPHFFKLSWLLIWMFQSGRLVRKISCRSFWVCGNNCYLILFSLGAVYLKNMITQNWQKREVEPVLEQPFHIHEQDQAAIRDAIVDAMVLAPDLIR